MKKFDWEYNKKIRGAEYNKFLLEVHELPLTEEKFVVEWKKLKGTNHPPCEGRKEYKALKTKFGFFQ